MLAYVHKFVNVFVYVYLCENIRNWYWFMAHKAKTINGTNNVVITSTKNKNFHIAGNIEIDRSRRIILLRNRIKWKLNLCFGKWFLFLLISIVLKIIYKSRKRITLKVVGSHSTLVQMIMHYYYVKKRSKRRT